jgi:ribosome maturation factor RimP
MTDQEKITGIVNELLKESDKFLVEVIIRSGNRIMVYFDCDNLVSIADCKQLSRSIENRLDRENEDFELTVSSSGMDRPLKLLRQYKKRIGQELEVLTNAGEKITGILIRADETSIELEHPVKNPKKELVRPNTSIETSQIKSAKIIIKIGK